MKGEFSLVPFRAGHALRIVKAQFPDYTLNEYRGIWESALVHETCGKGFTLLNGSEVIGAAGIDHHWDGVGEAWALLSPSAKQYRFTVYKCVLAGLRRIVEEKDYHRVQATVLKTWQEARAWVESFGFTGEGKMRKYDSKGNDYIMYARV